MIAKVLNVPNISCPHCAHTIQRELGQVKGVAEVQADVQTKRVSVKVDTPETLDAVLKTLQEIGYPAEE
ncbi:MAG: heavy-metal-associated domain-containing protein [Chloroflexi bacterium]|nr:heavy-metal-associated domain-containing protein [Chloroflexota bacterium]